MTNFAPDGTAYQMFGSQNDPVVVLIHGLGLNRAVWQWQIPRLQENFCVLAYDLYGHGESPPPPKAPDLRLFSRQVHNLLQQCGIDKAAMVGFSLGGMIARRFAQDFPAKVSALCILHSPHQRMAQAQDAILKRVDQARTQGPSSTVEAALERWFTDDYRGENPAMMALVKSWVMANNIDVYHTIYRVLAEGVDEITTPNPPISVPTLVVTGDQDYGNGPDMSHAIARDIVGAKTVILQGLRHMALAENPAAMNAILSDFLTETLRQGANHG
jgi:pimeloyl-ACP methyl ester carboxylesterase